MDNQSNITSADDLRQMLHKCRKCWRMTVNGSMIKSYDELYHVHIKKNIQNCAIIVNTLAISDVSHSPLAVGHWFNILIYNKQFAFICDGLNKVRQMPEVWRAIEVFCINNRLKIHYFTARYQLKNSDLCGYLACYFVSKCHNSTFRALLSLKKLLNNNAIKTNQRYIVTALKRHLSL